MAEQEAAAEGQSNKRARLRPPEEERLVVALHEACNAADSDRVGELLPEGVDPCACDRERFSPLHYCVGPWDETALETNARVKCCTLLLAYGARWNQGDEDGLTPLHWAVGRHMVQCVQLMVENEDADVNCQALAGQAPLHVAISEPRSTHPVMLQMLLSYGADVNIRDADDNTPLFLAMKRSSSVPLKDLLEAAGDKADLTLVNAEGYTLLQLAIKDAAISKATLLIRHGANRVGYDAEGLDALQMLRKYIPDVRLRKRFEALLAPILLVKYGGIMACLTSIDDALADVEHFPREWASAQRAAWKAKYRHLSLEDAGRAAGFKPVSQQVIAHPVAAAYKQDHKKAADLPGKDPWWFPTKMQFLAFRRERKLLHRASGPRGTQQRATVADKRVHIRQILDPTHPCNALKGNYKGALDPRERVFGLFTQPCLRQLGGAIKRGTIICEYTGEVYPLQHVVDNTHPYRSTGDQVCKSRQGFHVSFQASRGWAGRKASSDEGGLLCVDARLQGNEGRMANDYRDEHGKEVPGRILNAQYHEVVLNGWPHLFIVATQDIPEDTEITVTYGDQYWDAHFGILEDHVNIHEELCQVKLNLVEDLLARYKDGPFAFSLALKNKRREFLGLAPSEATSPLTANSSDAGPAKATGGDDFLDTDAFEEGDPEDELESYISDEMEDG